jgi:uncharacterized protein with PIN domain
MSNLYRFTVCPNCKKVIAYDDSIMAHGARNVEKACDLLREGKDVYYCINCGEVYDNGDTACTCGGSNVVKYFGYGVK